jgi:hypothetical protein
MEETPMSKKIYLALAIHNHQPVGNFDFVFAEAYEKAYLPMIEALQKHPAIRLALHYTGPLHDWLLANRPELIERIAALVSRGQVEMMTGGYYEPILVAIPDVDKLGQVRKLTQAVQDDFGYMPTGGWLAERVWEPHLAKPLAEAGVEYTIVDDTHFKYVGLEDKDLFGYYVTEEQGVSLKIFGTSMKLRYTIPWAQVEEVMAWLQDEATEAGTKVAVMGDDGEKFGLWPGTYQHVWGGESRTGGWMEQFFEALEGNAAWVETIPPGEYVRRFPALGRIYLPTASYDEMTEWALPARLSGEIVSLKHRLKEEGRTDILRFMRGGFWRYFMVKYPEVNTMHKKMLRVSEKVHSLDREAEGNLGDWQKEALDNLWAAQCNCPYWHGVFGGIYLPHIRTANYKHLLAAENLADEIRRGSQAWIEVSEVDLDRDSQPELLIEGAAMNLYFDPTRGGTLFEWDWRAKKFNLLNNLTRRPEGYHQTLVDAALKKAQEETAGEDEKVLTIHEIVRVKEEGLEKLLYYDWYRRTALIDHFLHPGVDLESFYRADYGEAGDFVAEPFAWQIEPAADGGVTVRLYRDGGVWVGEQFCPVRLEKAVHVAPGALELPVSYTILNKSAGPLETRFGVECNFGLLSGHAHDAYYRIPGLELDDRHLDSKGQIEGVSELALVHEYFGLEITLFLDRPATLWRLPIETISNSESGFERIYQCSCILPHWSIRLEAGESWKVGLRFALLSY